jgi:PAS domain S-box-containing protein
LEAVFGRKCWQRRFLSGAKGGCSQRLADIAANLGLDAAPVIETLHFHVGGATRTITFLCRCTSAGGAPPLFVAAVLDVFDRPEEAAFLAPRAAPPVRARAARHANKPIEPALPKAARSLSRPGAGSSRESLEKELRRQKAEFRELSAILDTAMDGIAVLDSQGQILSLNRSGEALFGYDQNEVAGEHFASLIAPESRGLANAYFEGLKSHGAASLLNRGREVFGLARQGGTIPVFMTLGRIGASPGVDEERAARFCALLRDLTHWKKVERELEEARKDAERASALKSDFLARISHEIRTPLNAILGFAEVMMDERFGAIGNQRYKDYLGDIHASGTLVMSLVNDLLDLSKIEAGKMDFAFASIDANRIVSECVSIMQPQASRERVALRLSLSPALPNILVLTNQLASVLTNGTIVVTNLNLLVANAQPVVSNLVTISAQLRDPHGSLGEWLIPTNINLELQQTLTNAGSTLNSAMSVTKADGVILARSEDFGEAADGQSWKGAAVDDRADRREQRRAGRRAGGSSQANSPLRMGRYLQQSILGWDRPASTRLSAGAGQVRRS